MYKYKINMINLIYKFTTNFDNNDLQKNCLYKSF